MNALTLSASRRRNQVVILTGVSPTAKSSTSLYVGFSRTLSRAWLWAKAMCTPTRLITMACVICALTAFFAGLSTTVSHSSTSRLLLAASSIIGLPLAITGAFLTANTKKGGMK